jgi:hypothetical protein
MNFTGIDLKMCPSGLHHGEVQAVEGVAYWINCECGWRTRKFKTYPGAVTAWNHRAARNHCDGCRCATAATPPAPAAGVPDATLIERHAVLRFLDTAEFTGRRADWVVTPKDNVKDGNEAFNLHDFDDVIIDFRDRIEAGEHVAKDERAVPGTGEGG